MTTIAKDNRVVTLINVFTVEPARQQQLVDLLIRATEVTMRHLPGFVSANIHKSVDGTRVANDAQWRSREDFEAMNGTSNQPETITQASHLARREWPKLQDASGSSRMSLNP